MDKASEERFDYHLRRFEGQLRTKPRIDAEVVPEWEEDGPLPTYYVAGGDIGGTRHYLYFADDCLPV